MVCHSLCLCRVCVHVFFIHSSGDWHHSLGGVMNTAMLIQIPLGNALEVAELIICSCFEFTSTVDSTNISLQEEWIWAFSLPSPAFIAFFRIESFTGMKWNLNAVLTCIFLIPKDTKFFIIIKYLYKFFWALCRWSAHLLIALFPAMLWWCF